jgi:hypothetical protein
MPYLPQRYWATISTGVDRRELADGLKSASSFTSAGCGFSRVGSALQTIIDELTPIPCSND